MGFAFDITVSCPFPHTSELLLSFPWQKPNILTTLQYSLQLSSSRENGVQFIIVVRKDYPFHPSVQATCTPPIIRRGILLIMYVKVSSWHPSFCHALLWTRTGEGTMGRELRKSTCFFFLSRKRFIQIICIHMPLVFQVALRYKFNLYFKLHQELRQ